MRGGAVAGAGPLAERIAVLAARLDGHPGLALLRRGDGWQVREILAHSADIAEVFCDRLVPGSFPDMVGTAVRQSDGRIDLDATNERMRALRGAEPARRSLERLARCLELARAAGGGGHTHAARRIRNHTLEHLEEIARILAVAALEELRPHPS